MKIRELNYDEQMEINGGYRTVTGHSRAGGGFAGGGGRSWGNKCERNWGKVASGIAEVGLGLGYKVNDNDNDNDAISALVDKASDRHIERGKARIKEGWYGGCSHTEYREAHKKFRGR